VTAVFDASVAGKLLFPEVRSDLALSLYEDIVATGEPVIAPTLLKYELVSVASHKMRYEGATLSRAMAALTHLPTYEIAYYDTDPVWERVLEIASAHRLLVYDVQYVVLAEAAQCHVWFDDEEVVTRLRRDFPFVRRLADYTPPPQDQ
jgi:predicted nucleic acid-binding protein